MEKENLTTPPPAKRRKSIKFGPELTPEEIDKKAPAIAPVSKGRTPPRRGSTGRTQTVWDFLKCFKNQDLGTIRLSSNKPHPPHH